MKTVILIPARLASTRFPEKMLQPLFDKPLIRHVYDECKKSGYDTFVLTDSKKIASIIPAAILTGKAENDFISLGRVMVSCTGRYSRPSKNPNHPGALITKFCDSSMFVPAMGQILFLALEWSQVSSIQ